ncbi:MAG: hypothetical protein ACP6IT_10625 [Candidatus Thorarchaeota archaeon]
MGLIDMGSMTCDVEIQSVPFSAGSPVHRNDLPNAPLLLDGQTVDALQVTFTITARGSHVDWSTLSLHIDALVGDEVVESYDLPETTLDSDSQEYHVSRTFMIEGLEEKVGDPVSVNEDGVETYRLECVIHAEGSVTDTKGHLLTDSVNVRHSWTFTTEPDGSFDITAENVLEPEFVKRPGASFCLAPGDSVTLLWIASDDNPDQYEISLYSLERGERVVRSGSWADGNRLDWSFMALEPGSYQVTCKVFDKDGNSAKDSVTITVFNHRSEPTSTDGTTGFPDRTLPRTDDSYVNSPFGGVVGGLPVVAAVLGLSLAMVVYLRRRD